MHQAQAQGFGAGVGVEHARGHAGGELVRVGHAVDAGERVLREDRLEVEVLRRRVEVGQAALILVGRVDVQQARLQRLAHGAAEPVRVALQQPRAVQTQARDQTRRAAAPVGERLVERIGRGVERQPRRQGPARFDERPADAAHRVQPHAGLARVRDGIAGVGEAVELGLQPDFETEPVALRITRADLRQTFVRRLDAAGRVLQHLPALHARIAGPLAQRATQFDVGRQQPRRQAETAWEVLPVVVVGHAQQAHLQVHVQRQAAVVGQVECVARVAGQPVLGQQVQVQLAFVAGFEVAEFGVEPGPALGADGGCQGRVAIRRDVPVVGRGHLQAALGVQVHGGRQPAGLALVVEREAQDRRGQDRYTVEAQHGAFGDAGVGVEVHPHLVGRQQPRRPAGPVAGAAGVGGCGGHGAVLVDEIQPLRSATRAGAAEEVARLQKVALETLQAQLQFRPAVHVAVAQHLDLALRTRQVFGGVVAEPVGADHQAAAAQFDIAFGEGFEVGAAAQLAGLQDDGQLAIVLVVRLLAQRRGLLQDDARRFGVIGPRGLPARGGQQRSDAQGREPKGRSAVARQGLGSWHVAVREKATGRCRSAASARARQGGCGQGGL